jgi:UDP-3-O-[3-hydroxymyristoyl] N-acetylglucosamine deacetylase/3-hydroxyacyl-[acyl-carrier-protein] dehydratase
MYFYCLCKLILLVIILFLFEDNFVKLIFECKGIMRQRTLSKPANLSGSGLHTGKPVQVAFLPAKANHGITFVRTDRPTSLPIPAVWRNVISTQRATVLGVQDVNVRTAEHVMAAVFGSGISNLRIELNAEELPILDGSSRIYSEVLSAGHIIEQAEERPSYRIEEEYTYGDPQKKSLIKISPYDAFRITYRLNFNEKIRQVHDYTFSPESFQNEIAGARTFCLLSEMDAMRKAGLVSGIDPNAGFVVIDDAAKIDLCTSCIGFFRSVERKSPIRR